MNIPKTALKFGDETFQNALEEVAVLNPGVPLRTQGVNINWNALVVCWWSTALTVPSMKFGSFPEWLMVPRSRGLLLLYLLSL